MTRYQAVRLAGFTTEALERVVTGAVPIGPYTWAVTTPSGSYEVQLWAGADGWYGYCECSGFEHNRDRAQGLPTPCKHLAWLQYNFKSLPGAGHQGSLFED